jgi:phosphomevalonate kinase
VIATAPGKLHLAGEYAVLDGAEAVVCAIDRRATARATGPGAESAFLDALADVLAARAPEAAAIVRRIEVDTAALRSDTVKLGLGSSAAATVAACACALASTGGALDRDLVHQLARAAHADAQARRGARGSGADVAAAVHGGVIAVTPATHADALPIIRRLELPPLRIVPFWTGRPADTVALVSAVAAAVGRPGVDAAITDIAHASEALVVAGTVDGRPDARRTAAAITAIAAAGDAIASLARATGLELEPPVVALAGTLAEPLGGAVKTTGAGGGDVAIAVIPPGADEAALREALAAAGAMPLDLRIEARGVDIEATPE